MKAIRATLTTSQPVITEDEFQTMFYKIDDLHEVHTEFLNELKNKTSQLTSNGDIYVGEVFKKLASIFLLINIIYISVKIVILYYINILGWSYTFIWCIFT